jgi:hypothetical protein
LNVSRGAAPSPQSVGSPIPASPFHSLQRSKVPRGSLRKHSTGSLTSPQKTAATADTTAGPLLQPPLVTERDSVELSWTGGGRARGGGGGRYPMESASLRETVDSLPSSYPARETFDSILSTSQVSRPGSPQLTLVVIAESLSPAAPLSAGKAGEHERLLCGGALAHGG